MYFFPKLFVASICGGIIGIERELKHRSAGLKTNVLICVGATLYTSLGLIMFPSATDRVISQIITGVGFLGAGCIFRTDDKVKGLTTAAFIWVGAAIGIMVAAGGNSIAILTSIGCIGSSLLLSKIEEKIK
jgi:putative Mg2+ transporter-C (MgtC) family protein